MYAVWYSRADNQLTELIAEDDNVQWVVRYARKQAKRIETGASILITVVEDVDMLCDIPVVRIAGTMA